MSTVQLPRRTREAQERKAPAIPAERVREMLREIAFVLHATRVVRRLDGGAAAKRG